MTDPFRIIFVCTGNICRSPMAEAMLKKQLSNLGILEGVEVLSAGTSTSDGMPASRHSVSTCKHYDVELNGFGSTALTKEFCESAHLILALDHPHRQFIDEHMPQRSDRTRMLASFLTSDPGRLGIPDPIGGSEELYGQVGEIIYRATEQMANNWERIKRRFYDDPRLVVAIGADHRGFAMKGELIERLQADGYHALDCGTDSNESCDHPDFAVRVGEAVALGDADRGVLICGSGHGMIIAANKVPSARAIMPYDEEHALISRKHNNANVLVFGSDFFPPEQIASVASAWIKEPFLGGRYQRRINKISNYENLY